VFSKDGKTIIYAVTDSNVSKSSIILEIDDNDDSSPTVLTPPDPKGDQGGAWASDPAVSPDGNRIAFVSDRAKPFHYDIFIMNRDGTEPPPLGVTSVSCYNGQPVFTPDGKSVMFLAGTEHNVGGRAIYSLWQVGADGKDPRRIADSDLFTKPMEWKPKP
jgi:Tol biopolymer transport system component